MVPGVMEGYVPRCPNEIGPSLRDFGSFFNAFPGLRCACPGLSSISPSGRMAAAVSFAMGRESQWKSRPCSLIPNP